MDPVRRLILLGIVASVILTEPAQARALFAANDSAAQRQPPTATERWITQLAVVLRQTMKPAVIRVQRFGRPIDSAPRVERLCTAGSRLLLLPFQFDLPPPAV